MNPVWEPYAAMITAWAEDMDSCIEGGETGRQVLTRFDAAMADLAAAHEVVSVVSHGAMLGVWATARLGVDPSIIGALKNTDVIVVEGNPESGWQLISLAEL